VLTILALCFHVIVLSLIPLRLVFAYDVVETRIWSQRICAVERAKCNIAFKFIIFS